MIVDDIEIKNLMKWMNCWSCTNIFTKKNLTGVIFLLTPAASLLGKSQFFIGCMKRQHAVILESIWETDSTIIFLPPNGRDASLLFWLALLCSSSPLSWKIYSKSNSIFPLLSWTKLFWVQLLFPFPFEQNISTSKFPLLFALLGQMKNSSF